MEEHNCSIVSVRTLQSGELWSVYEVEASSFEEPYPAWLFKAIAALAGDLFLVGVNGDYIIGYAAALMTIDNVCHLASIAVRPECRGRGNGHVMLCSIEEACSMKGAVAVMLEVDAYNWVAQRLYISHGYMPAAFMPDYYGVSRPAILMIKPLRG